jgi:PAS domain S-box-containing protein
MNQELQANYQIVALLEKSKALSEKILDSMSGIFLHLNQAGIILKSNIEFGAICGTPQEDLLGVALAIFMSPADWDFFQNQMSAAKAEVGSVQKFQLPLQVMGSSRTFFWQLSSVLIGSKESGILLYNCAGQDISELLNAHAKLVTARQDLDLIENVQNLILPTRTEFKSAKLDFGYAFYPAESAAGDYVWFEQVTDSKFCLFVGDVTGHGSGSAMVTALVAGCVQSAWFRCAQGREEFKIKAVVEDIHRILSHLPSQPYWMSMTAVEIDCLNSKATFCTAGSPPVFLKKATDEVKLITFPISAPLGSPSLEIADSQMDLVSGHRLAIITDGALEARNSSGREFGYKGIERFMKAEGATAAPQAACESLKNEINKWSGTDKMSDDVTLLILDWK